MLPARECPLCWADLRCVAGTTCTVIHCVIRVHETLERAGLQVASARDMHAIFVKPVRVP